MWLIWRPGSPDPSRPSPAIHFDDPAKDRKDGARQQRLGPPILIAPEHQAQFRSGELPLRDLVLLEPYRAPPMPVTINA